MQMYVIFVYAYFFQVPIWMKFSHFLDCLFKILRYPSHEDFSSIPRGPHDVILSFVDYVSLPMQLHSYILPSRTASNTRLLAHIPTLTGGVFPLE